MKLNDCEVAGLTLNQPYRRDLETHAGCHTRPRAHTEISEYSLRSGIGFKDKPEGNKACAMPEGVDGRVCA